MTGLDGHMARDGAVMRVSILELDDDQLVELSENWGLALSLDEMRRIVDHFRGVGRDPTDLEVQALGQAWSEHSCYKSSKALLKEHVFSIRPPHFLMNEDAGVATIDDEHVYVVALESHNHPSAIGPYGGAATGIGGILRDVVCMGAQPFALIDPLFFGPLEHAYDELPKGVKHPKYLLKGVMEGIRDYGNRVGIPTTTGVLCFHPGYTGNCLVNVGCIGVAKRDEIIRSRVGGPGDIFILAGGRTGRDGIHGVTFASEVLDEESEEEDMGAVQLGDPITKEPLIHSCLDANRRKLLTGMKDLGGGGLSSCLGEMALAAGYGATVTLENVPLKEEGLEPWEIWISESQERMMVSVRPEQVETVLHIFDSWDVEANVVGEVVDGGDLTIRYHGQKVLELDLEFYSGGPVYNRDYVVPEREEVQELPPAPEDHTKVVLDLLGRPNLSAKDWIIREYDHMVRASTSLPPLQGLPGRETHGDAAVMTPIRGSDHGIALACGVLPYVSEIDPYNGAAMSVDEAIRNVLAVGAVPSGFADCLNFGSPEKPDRFWTFRETVKAFGDIGSALQLPFISGNVSFYNETPSGPIPPTPTVLAIGLMADFTTAVTPDLKSEGSILYLLGRTGEELGGSEYIRMQGGNSTITPSVDIKLLEGFIDAIPKAVAAGLITSCHDVSDGGVSCAIAEMCIGGDRGARIDLTEASELAEAALYSESPTRWVVEVAPENVEAFEKAFDGLPVLRIGTAEGSSLVIEHAGKEFVSAEIDALRKAWTGYLWNIMG